MNKLSIARHNFTTFIYLKPWTKWTWKPFDLTFFLLTLLFFVLIWRSICLSFGSKFLNRMNVYIFSRQIKRFNTFLLLTRITQLAMRNKYYVIENYFLHKLATFLLHLLLKVCLPVVLKSSTSQTRWSSTNATENKLRKVKKLEYKKLYR